MLDTVARDGLVLLGCGKMGTALLTGWLAAGIEVAHSLETALHLVADVPRVFVIGGAQIYAEALPLLRRAHRASASSRWCNTWGLSCSVSPA